MCGKQTPFFDMWLLLRCCVWTWFTRCARLSVAPFTDQLKTWTDSHLAGSAQQQPRRN